MNRSCLNIERPSIVFCGQLQPTTWRLFRGIRVAFGYGLTLFRGWIIVPGRMLLSRRRSSEIIARCTRIFCLRETRLRFQPFLSQFLYLHPPSIHPRSTDPNRVDYVRLDACDRITRAYGTSRGLKLEISFDKYVCAKFDWNSFKNLLMFISRIRTIKFII